MPSVSAIDLMIVGGRVSTGLAGQPDQEAVAIRGADIVAVGTDAELAPLCTETTRVIDAEGGRVIPGLIDSHSHVVRAGATWSERLDWSETSSLEQALSSLRTVASRRPPGSWLTVVGGWHPGRFREGRGPTVAELDAAAPNHPVYVQLLYERAWVNSAGLTALGVGPETPDPPRGSFERGPGGEPTGAMHGAGAFVRCLEAAGQPSFEDQLKATSAFFAHLNSLGLTGALDPGGLGMSPESYRPVYELWRRRDLTVRLRLFMMPDGRQDELDQVRDFVKYLHPDFGDEWLRLGGLGEIPTMSVWDGEGVHPFPIGSEALDLLEQVIRLLASHGWSVHQHAVLDETIGRVLDVWEDVNVDIPLGPLRFALAHAEPISDVNLERVRRLGAGIAVQNRMVYRAADSAELWGAEVLRRAPPLRKILELGIPLGAGTDATAVSPYNPWWSIWWLVTGRSVDGAPPRAEEHRLTRQEALAAYTRGSAWFSKDEQRRGALAPGQAADLAILSDDYFTVPEDEIPGLRAVTTVVGGKVVHGHDRLVDKEDA